MLAKDMSRYNFRNILKLMNLIFQIKCLVYKVWSLHTILMLRNIYKHYFSILAQDKVLFFGSGRVAFPSAVKLHENYPNLHVVTHYTPQRQKFKNEVELFCRQKSILCSTPIRSKGDKAKVKEEWDIFGSQIQDPDFGVVCSFGYMIPQKIINRFKKGMIVIHPSLLPKYRGGSPIFHAIANGQSVSGASYIQISPGKFDSGNLLLQKEYPLSQTAKYQQVEAELAKFCAQNLLQVLNNIEKLRPGIPQSQLTLPEHQQWKLKAPIVKDKHLNLNQLAQKVYNLSRALGNPRVKFGEKDIILNFENKYLEDEENKQPGTLKIKGKKLYVKCQDKFIKIDNWKQPSKKQTPCGIFIAAFLRGKDQSTWPKFV